jgi:hypothetical protein
MIYGEQTEESLKQWSKLPCLHHISALNITPILSLAQLTSVKLGPYSEKVDYSNITTLSNLKQLNLLGPIKRKSASMFDGAKFLFEKVWWLTKLTSLHSLKLPFEKSMASIVQNCTFLTALKVMGIQFEDLDSLIPMTHLKCLTMHFCCYSPRFTFNVNGWERAIAKFETEFHLKGKFLSDPTVPNYRARFVHH